LGPGGNLHYTITDSVQPDNQGAVLANRRLAGYGIGHPQ